MASAAQPAPEIPDKSLFRIGEVSRLTATKTFVLRYWESEFPTLQPVKSPSGHRLYRREDIETVFEIKRLLYDQGFTIAGARKHLAEKNGANGHITSAAAPVTAVAPAANRAPDEPQPVQAVAPQPRPPQPSPQSRAHRKLLLDLHEELRAILTLLKRE
jgi:DNA-binding transcriptional MerR regulator